MEYRIVGAGGTRMYKRYFHQYDSALSFFERAIRSLHPYGYVELQENLNGVWQTVEQEVGSAI